MHSVGHFGSTTIEKWHFKVPLVVLAVSFNPISPNLGSKTPGSSVNCKAFIVEFLFLDTLGKGWGFLHHAGEQASDFLESSLRAKRFPSTILAGFNSFLQRESQMRPQRERRTHAPLTMHRETSWKDLQLVCNCSCVSPGPGSLVPNLLRLAL